MEKKLNEAEQTAADVMDRVKKNPLEGATRAHDVTAENAAVASFLSTLRKDREVRQWAVGRAVELGVEIARSARHNVPEEPNTIGDLKSQASVIQDVKDLTEYFFNFVNTEANRMIKNVEAVDKK